MPPPVTAKDERIGSLETALADALIHLERLQARQQDTVADMPPNAQQGSCYAKLLVPARYVDRSERRIVKEATERIELLPAKTAWVEEKVLVSEEHVQLKVVPATYKWVEEKTEILPARRKQVLVSPAQYKTVVEQVLETPEETEWRPGRGEQERIDPDSGEILHLATIPARYRNISKQVLVAPAEYRTEVVPAVYQALSKKVVDRPEHTVEVVEPAVYKTVRVQRVVEPERELRHVVPAQYKTFQYREKVADAKPDWREIPCQKTLGEARVRRLQQALKAAGFDPGYADGILGGKTLNAVAAYQQQQGLASGRLSVEAMAQLGVDGGGEQ